MKKVIYMLGIVAALVVPVAATAASGSTKANTNTLRSDDQNLRITITDWMPNARVDEFNAPGLGKKYVAIKLRVTNLANVAWDDSLENGAELQDTQHRSYDADVVIDDSKPTLPDRIQPHDWATGWIFFEVANTAKPRMLSITLDSGFADEASATGTWRF
jgi:hypothetical protein